MRHASPRGAEPEGSQRSHCGSARGRGVVTRKRPTSSFRDEPAPTCAISRSWRPVAEAFGAQIRISLLARPLRARPPSKLSLRPASRRCPKVSSPQHVRCLAASRFRRLPRETAPRTDEGPRSSRGAPCSGMSSPPLRLNAEGGSRTKKQRPGRAFRAPGPPVQAPIQPIGQGFIHASRERRNALSRRGSLVGEGLAEARAPRARHVSGQRCPIRLHPPAFLRNIQRENRRYGINPFGFEPLVLCMMITLLRRAGTRGRAANGRGQRVFP